MSQYLIIIRGNSASGKSSLAELLREEIGGKVAIVGQDTLRRTILKEQDLLEQTDIIGLLEQTVQYCLEKGYSVIVEGILSKPKYKEVLEYLCGTADCPSHIYYIDVSLEETLKRHRTKSIADDVADEQLISWYQSRNYLDIPGEIIFSEDMSLDEMVKSVINQIQ